MPEASWSVSTSSGVGHSSIRVTSDRYGHLFPTAKEGMRDGLERSYRAAHGSGS